MTYKQAIERFITEKVQVVASGQGDGTELTALVDFALASKPTQRQLVREHLRRLATSLVVHRGRLDAAVATTEAERLDIETLAAELES